MPDNDVVDVEDSGVKGEDQGYSTRSFWGEVGSKSRSAVQRGDMGKDSIQNSRGVDMFTEEKRTSWMCWSRDSHLRSRCKKLRVGMALLQEAGMEDV